MYSILIVDDEEIILNGIKDAVTASALPLKSVQTAASADAVLQMLVKNPCDILVSDIRMPDMDGLEMAERARQIWPETRIIFLTGYQDFEYARKALRLNSDDYLLKPVSDDKLIQVIGNVISKLDSLWMERFALRYRKGTETGSTAVDPGKAIYFLWIGYEEDASRMSARELHKSLCGMLERLFGHYCSTVLFEEGESNTAVWLQPVVEETYWDKVCLKTLEELQSFFLDHLDVNMSIGLSQKIRPEEGAQTKKKMKEACAGKEKLGSLFLLGKEETEKENGAENYAVMAVQAYIRKNPEKDLSLGALSEKFRMNPSYLSRVFHQEAGIPISEFIVQIRLVLAKRLLADTDMKIYEIAQRAGFETPGYFTKVFNKAEKMSPKNYRLTKSKDKAEK